MNDKIKVKATDNKIIEVSSEIGKVVNLIKDILMDFDNSECINLDVISSVQLQKVINFCELINYTPIVIKDKNRVLPKDLKNKFSSKLLKYYNELSQEEIVDLLSISDYLAMPSLDNFCLIKLVEVFRDENKIKSFLNGEVDLKIDKERELYLREKYKNDYSCNDLSEQEVKDMLETFDEDYC